MAYQWRIRHKLMLGLVLAAAIMALLLGGTMKGLFSYRATMRTVGSKLEELGYAVKLRSAVEGLGQPLRNPKNPGSEMNQRQQEAKEALDRYHERLQDSIDRHPDPQHGCKELPQVHCLEEGLATLAVLLEKPLAPQALGPADLHGDPLGPDVRAAVEKLVTASVDLISIINGDLTDRIGVSKRDYKFSMIVVISISVVGVLLMGALLRWFYRWVFYPIRDLNQGVERVARGDFEHRIQVKSGDEIEDLAAAFNDMAARLREMYADLAQKVNDRSRQLVRSERLAGVGFLAAGVAHEINNPLASIAFCSEALEGRLADSLPGLDGQDREIIAKYLKMIQQEAFRCKEITQKLLEFSRGGERRREATNLGDLIQGVLDMVQHLPNSKGKHVVVHLKDKITAWVNSQEIKSVVLNLIVNALDSMDEQGTLTITQQILRDGMVELRFEDTGCGMPSGVLENICEPFFSRSRTGKGTGLGLSISHRIISQHGGEIEATSAGPGQGSIFTVRLPLKPLTEQEGQPEVMDPETEFSKRRGQALRRAA